MIVSIRGPRSTGKSTFAASWKYDVEYKKWWLDYERGAERGLSEERYPDWKESITLWNPADEPDGLRLLLLKMEYTQRGKIQGQIEMWEILRKKFYEVIGNPTYRTLILDTARLVWQTDHQAHLQYLQDLDISNHRDKIKQTLGSYEYSTPNARMEGLFLACQAANKDLLLINHERPVYIDVQDSETGLWKSVPKPDGETY